MKQMRQMAIRTALTLMALTVVGMPVVATAATPEASDRKQVEVTILLLSDIARFTGRDCRIDNDRQRPALRFTASDDGSQTIESFPLSNGSTLQSNNDELPGYTLCSFVKTVEFRTGLDYRLTIDDVWMGDLRSTTISENSDLRFVISVSGVWTVYSDTLEVPTPAPTPLPSPTPLPTPTPAPAGDQGDGTYLLRGYLMLFDRNAVERSGECYGAGGYSDIGSGVQVVVRDGNNNVMGVGKLVADETSASGQGCSFEFEVEVQESEFYQIEIGHRGEMVYSFEELEERDWIIGLSLGN